MEKDKKRDKRSKCEIHCHDDEEAPLVLLGEILEEKIDGEILLSIKITDWPEALMGGSDLVVGNGMMIVKTPARGEIKLYLTAVLYHS